MVLGLTPGVLSTRAAHAQRLALPAGAVALLIAAAVVVVLASDVLTANEGVALKADRADADGQVVLGLALGPGAARGIKTGVDTLVVIARLVQRAVLVGAALILVTLHVRVSCPACWTLANSPVLSGLTERILATGVGWVSARVLALLFHANLTL